jgi:hypothetical protein
VLIQDDGRGKEVVHNDVGSSLSLSVILSQGVAHPFPSPSSEPESGLGPWERRIPIKSNVFTSLAIALGLCLRRVNRFV